MWQVYWICLTAKADAIAKLIPDELGIDLKSSYEKEPKI